MSKSIMTNDKIILSLLISMCISLVVRTLICNMSNVVLEQEKIDSYLNLCPEDIYCS